MKRHSNRWRLLGIAVTAVALVATALGFGIAQSTVVTQAEWSVYLAQGLGLDWNMPAKAKSNHYLARLEWTKSIEFQAAQMLDGSTARKEADGSIQAGFDTPVEALYQIAMLRAGDYGLRVKLAGGGAHLKIGSEAYELYQPSQQPQWVDLNRVRLSPGSHKISLMLTNGARAESLGVTPPCMLPVEPLGGWKPLQPLHFEDMAVTLAKALDLEQNLPKLGDPLTVRGEDFVRTLSYPYVEKQAETEEKEDPFWLSSGSSIVTAVARFEVPEDGVYSIDARYISPRSVRWNVDSCLRMITCPVTPAQLGRRRGLALELQAGTHEIEVTLAPGARLDRIEVQKRDGSAAAYVDIVQDEGFKMGQGGDDVTRREALAAARRLGDRFSKLAAVRCEDAIIAMETAARARAIQAAAASDPEQAGAPAAGNAPGASSGSTQTSFSDPVFPPVDSDDPRVASPVEPGQ